MGAFCGAWLMRGDLRALPIFGRWTKERLGPLGRALLARDRDQARQLALSLGGTLAGIPYGLRMRAHPARFAADRRPPALPS